MFVKALKIDDDFPYYTDGVYLHGQLQDLNGYDIVYLSSVPKEEGIYPVEVEIGGQIINANLYFWFGDPNILNGLRGLIVDPNDTIAVQDAIRKFGDKAHYL